MQFKTYFTTTQTKKYKGYEGKSESQNFNIWRNMTTQNYVFATVVVVIGCKSETDVNATLYQSLTSQSNQFLRPVKTVLWMFEDISRPKIQIIELQAFKGPAETHFLRADLSDLSHAGFALKDRDQI